MGELFFVIKGFALTVLLTMALQIKIGQETLESKAEQWATRSAMSSFLNDTAAGAVKAIRDGTKWVKRELGESDRKSVV